MVLMPRTPQPWGHDHRYTTTPIRLAAPAMSVFVWVMVGVAFWHFSVLVPDRFYGGVIGALVAAVAGALLSGYLLPSPGIPAHNPPRSHRGRVANSWIDRRPGWGLSLRRSLRAPPGAPAVARDSRLGTPLAALQAAGAHGASQPDCARDKPFGRCFDRWVVLPWGNGCHTHCDHAGLSAILLSMLEAIHTWETEGGALRPSGPDEQRLLAPQAASAPTAGRRPPKLPLRCAATPPVMIVPRGTDRGVAPRDSAAMPCTAQAGPCAE